jgi:hypothetical protein
MWGMSDTDGLARSSLDQHRRGGVSHAALVRPGVFAVALMAAQTISPAQAASQILETETARSIGSGGFELGSNFEYQVSSEGYEIALPFAFEYGLSDRLELLVEPVAYNAIRPKVGPRATGRGDLETTVTYLTRQETVGTPAIALAGEVKFPTTHNTLIGTGRPTSPPTSPAASASAVSTPHADVGYTIVGGGGRNSLDSRAGGRGRCPGLRGQGRNAAWGQGCEGSRVRRRGHQNRVGRRGRDRWRSRVAR